MKLFIISALIVSSVFGSVTPAAAIIFGGGGNLVLEDGKWVIKETPKVEPVPCSKLVLEDGKLVMKNGYCGSFGFRYEIFEDGKWVMKDTQVAKEVPVEKSADIIPVIAEVAKQEIDVESEEKEKENLLVIKALIEQLIALQMKLILVQKSLGL